MMLSGKVAIVTGASREIGATMAEALAAEGAAVIVAHYGEDERAQQVVQRIGELHGHAHAVNLDLSSVQANVVLVRRAVAQFGRLDIFVANAGLTRWSPLLEAGEAMWHELVDLNLKGSFFGAQAAARQMVQQGDGCRIVFSSSVTGVCAVPEASIYSITKAALRHMAVVFAEELGSHHITANAIGIGATLNERNLANEPDYAERWAGVVPTGRVGMPADIASALLFLVSPGADMVTGHTLMVDGGWSNRGHMP
jgi:NAD(P)-dependent dehydrogenase (short-subunit alcohol dehydrogenase family)